MEKILEIWVLHKWDVSNKELELIHHAFTSYEAGKNYILEVLKDNLKMIERVYSNDDFIIFYSKSRDKDFALNRLPIFE